MQEQIVFDTRWFQLVAKYPPGWSDPHYSIRTADYVTVIARTPEGEGAWLLVRQYRPAVEMMTLEFPSGHVEPGQTPEEAARCELAEETGYRANRLDLVGQLAPDVGRLCNRLWVYFAPELVALVDHQPEPGIEVVHYTDSLAKLVKEKDFCHAFNHAALLLALAGGQVPLAALHQTERDNSEN
jgi:ADP-ribose pyrophosphatase